MAKTFNTKAKSLIRNEWGKPILKFLSKRLDKKLLYLGLPSPAAEDIDDWIEFIDEVIAFQCREYGKPSNINQSRKEIEELEEKLNKYERQGLLNTFTVYDGYIEEVVLRGIDNVSKEFTQSNTIKIYNLDFCNSITYPTEYTNSKGEVVVAYKFNAVKKLLNFQYKLDKDSQEFVLFLTIHSSYQDKLLQEYINNPDTNEHKLLLESYKAKGKKKEKKKERILKLFVIDTLASFFRDSHFVPHFLPTILYKGLVNTKLLHFSILASKEESTVGKTNWFQGIGELCAQKLLTTNNDKFEVIEDKSLKEVNIKNIDPMDLFSNSKTYQKVWQN